MEMLFARITVMEKGPTPTLVQSFFWSPAVDFATERESDPNRLATLSPLQNS